MTAGLIASMSELFIPTTPGGSSGQVQFNNSAKFGADSNLFWDNTNKRLGIGTSTPAARLSVQGTSSTDFAVLGTNQLTSTAFNNATYWTITAPGDWTLAATTATHVAGNTDPLLATLTNFTPVAGQWYRIQLITSLNTSATDSVTPVIGGTSGPAISTTASATVRVIIQAGTASNLEFIPTSGWTGRIASLQVAPITPAPAVYTGTTSGGTDILEMRHINDTTSLYLGLNAGRMSTNNNSNNLVIGNNALPFGQIAAATVAIGTNALATLVSGSNNVAVGFNTLKNSISGSFNTALGGNALTATTFGGNNTAIGSGTLGANTTGGNNTALGTNALSGNTTGGSNTGVATNALGLVSTGSNNVAIGNSAGITSTSSNAVTTGSGNTFIGTLSGPNTATQLSNASAFGYLAVVGVSNALVLGAINGQNGATSNVAVGIGTATPGELGGLEMVGNLNLDTAGAKLKIATGSNASIGTGTLSAGTVTISTTAVTASSLVFLTATSTSANQGILSVGTITAGTGFVVNSTNGADANTFNWWIVN